LDRFHFAKKFSISKRIFINKAVRSANW